MGITKADFRNMGKNVLVANSPREIINLVGSVVNDSGMQNGAT